MKNISRLIQCQLLALSCGLTMAQTPLQPLSDNEAANLRQTIFGAAAPSPDSETTSATYNCFLLLGVDGLRRFHTEISVTNTLDQQVSVLVEMFGPDGKPLVLPFNNQSGSFAGYYNSAGGTLAPGETRNPLLMAVSSPLQLGWIRVTADVPGAIDTRTFVTALEATRMGAFIHQSSSKTSGPVDIGVENGPGPKQTMLAVVNPADEPVDLVLTARLANGEPACSPATISLQPRQQIWQSAQSLISCPPGTPNYTLNVAPANGAVAVQSYYDYGNLFYHAAPVRAVMPPVQTELVVRPDAAAAKAVDCTPALSPQTKGIGPAASLLRVDISFPLAGSAKSSCQWNTGRILASWWAPLGIDDSYSRGPGSVLIEVDEIARNISTRKGSLPFNVLGSTNVVKWKTTFTFTQTR